MNILHLKGCRHDILGHYLKAIGFGTGAKDTVDYLAIQKTALAAP